MTREEKQLLLKDLCARLPYGVKFQGKDSNVYTLDAANYFALQVENMVFKPYLRPMSSITEEEKKKYHNLCYEEEKEQIEFGEWVTKVYYHDTIESIDWLIAHHFDYRGLIEKGLALEASEGMYEG